MLLMRIALALGKSLRQVQALDADEILWWEAMFIVDPPGEQRMDARFAMLCQMVAAFGGNPPARHTFMLFPDSDPEAEKPISGQKLDNVMRQAQAWMTNGNDGRKA